MNNLIEKNEITNKIYEIRGKEVMLDSDLAKFYGIETKQLKRQVKRNMNRFPSDFCFEITYEEYDAISRCQIGTLKGRGHNLKYLPYVFTEQGIAMLSSVINSKKAIEVNIEIMRAFVSMRHYLMNNADVYVALNNLNNKMNEHDKKLDYLFKIFDKKEKLFLSGSVYDAYSSVIDIFNIAKNEIIIIDNYADKYLLDIIKNYETKIILITKNNTKTFKKEIDIYNKQYNNLKVIYDNSFHDRYFIIDRNYFYHCGTSLNYIGNKTFSINKLDNNDNNQKLLEDINKLINK